MFPEVDPVLGPEMRSTGEVMGLADSFGMAFYKAQEATQLRLPTEGCVLITVADHDKPGILEAARLFREMKFCIFATQGTHKVLQENGIESKLINKVDEGRPNIIDAIKNNEIHLVINSPSTNALSAAKGIAKRREGQAQVKSLQSYHAEIQ
jgi:carbamoyl-phosphate synthase large subunit